MASCSGSPRRLALNPKQRYDICQVTVSPVSVCASRPAPWLPNLQWFQISNSQFQVVCESGLCDEMLPKPARLVGSLVGPHFFFFFLRASRPSSCGGLPLVALRSTCQASAAIIPVEISNGIRRYVPPDVPPIHISTTTSPLVNAKPVDRSTSSPLALMRLKDSVFFSRAWLVWQSPIV